MRSFNNLKIRDKIVLGYITVFIVAVGSGVLSVRHVMTLNAISTAISDNVQNLAQLGNIRRDGAEIDAITALNIISATASGSPIQVTNFRASAKQAEENFAQQWDAFSQSMDPGRETTDGTAFRAAFTELLALSSACADAITHGDFPTANQIILDKMPDTKDRFMKAVGDAISYEQSDTIRLNAEARSQSRFSIIAAVTGLAVMLVAIFGSVAMAIGKIARPIGRMTEAMRRLAQNDTEVTVPALGQKDEIGAMAEAVKVFRENAMERTRLEAEAAVFQTNLDRKLRDTEAAFTESGREQKRAMDGVSAALAQLAEGDLTARFETEVSESYRALRADFNNALATLQQTMQAIAVNTAGVRSGASEIQQAAGDLSHRTEQQAASLEETAAALDEITATVRKTAGSVDEAQQLVRDTRGSAERSGNVVRDAVQAMSGIEQSSRQIANIISVIDEIAFQTNLLALNAGVEAARAGDAGRGFAVVATEVRTLAQRSAEAAKEIKTLILTSGQQVTLGVKLVSETGTVLGVIVDQVMRLNGLMNDVANSAREQSTALEQVNSTMNQMDQVTQRNAAMVEEATAASHGLAREASDLAQLVGQFNIGTQGKGAPQAANHPAPTRRDAARPGEARSGESRPNSAGRARMAEAAP